MSFAHGSAAASGRKIKGHRAFTICISQNYQHGRRGILGRIEEQVGTGLVWSGRGWAGHCIVFMRLHIALVWGGLHRRPAAMHDRRGWGGTLVFFYCWSFGIFLLRFPALVGPGWISFSRRSRLTRERVSTTSHHGSTRTLLFSAGTLTRLELSLVSAGHCDCERIAL